MDKEELVVLGMCTKPHGIRGGFTFSLENHEESVLSKGSKVYLFPRNSSSSIKAEGEVHTIDKISFGNKVIVYLKDISDRNIVEAMIPYDIKFPRSEFPEIDEDEYYLADIVGIEVLEHGTDEVVGKVTRYYDNGMQIILSIGGHRNSFEIPFVDQFVPEVDIENGKIWVVIPEVI